MKYRIGQKVKITKAKRYQPKNTVGKIGIVVGYIEEANGYEIAFINKKLHTGFYYDWIYGEDEITSIKTKKNKK